MPADGNVQLTAIFSAFNGNGLGSNSFHSHLDYLESVCIVTGTMVQSQLNLSLEKLGISLTLQYSFFWRCLNLQFRYTCMYVHSVLVFGS